ncbi:MAG: hypothetical protein JRG73_14960 [Deltaproteobacteria bacterium]|nr:hypothetical protein [Deltaproteobacteria bacterium]MBW2308224.1 hypothetical protein [Deltaproteobacteria bacterium]
MQSEKDVLSLLAHYRPEPPAQSNAITCQYGYSFGTDSINDFKQPSLNAGVISSVFNRALMPVEA